LQLAHSLIIKTNGESRRNKHVSRSRGAIIHRLKLPYILPPLVRKPGGRGVQFKLPLKTTMSFTVYYVKVLMDIDHCHLCMEGHLQVAITLSVPFRNYSYLCQQQPSLIFKKYLCKLFMNKFRSS